MWEIEGEGIKKKGGATHGVRFWRNRMNQGKGMDGRGGLKQTKMLHPLKLEQKG